MCVWEGVGDRTELQHTDPRPMGHNCVSFPFSWAAQPEAWGPTLLGAGFSTASCHQRVWSPKNWLPVFIELYNRSIAHSISLEWHVWSSSSGNNCHAVHRSLSSGASVYDCTAGFYLVPYCQPTPPTRFLPINAMWWSCVVQRLEMDMMLWIQSRIQLFAFKVTLIPMNSSFLLPAINMYLLNAYTRMWKLIWIQSFSSLWLGRLTKVKEVSLP